VTDTSKSVVSDRELEAGKNQDSSGSRIRCSLWRLVAREGRQMVLRVRARVEHVDTGGVCPTCLHQWTETQCLSCSRWSPHSDWYPTLHRQHNFGDPWSRMHNSGCIDALGYRG
jgi:hypothetical protein